MSHHLALVVALMALVVVIVAVARWRLRQRPDPTLAEDRAAPYREGLHAAIRMQAAAQELEQQLYAEAARRAEADAAGEP
jgi:hypothetical protein